MASAPTGSSGRWKLEPGERAGDKFHMKNPITYYFDPNAPQAYRAGFKAGIDKALSAGLEAERR